MLGFILAAAQEQNMVQTFIMFGILILFGYFLIWRPEQKRRKKMHNLRSGMKVGDKVTAMGIVAEVAEIKDNTVIVQNIDGSKLEMIKASVTEVLDSSN